MNDNNEIFEDCEDNWFQNYLNNDWKINYSKQHNLVIFEKDKYWFSISMSENQYQYQNQNAIN